MTERSKFFDDLAGVAGGAMSALAGLREEAESTIRARVEEVIRKLDLVRREDLEAVQEMAANARAGQTAMEARVVALETRVIDLEARVGGLSATASASASATAVNPTPPVATEEPRPETPEPTAPKSVQ